MANSITNRQLAFILIMTLTCYSVVIISKDVVLVAGTGAWLSVLIASLLFAFAASLIVYLNYLFRGKVLFEYSQQIITKPGAYLISIVYILYFLFILVFLITQFSKLLNQDFFPRTPLWAFPLVGIPVFCFIAYKGITNVARLAEIIGSLFIITALFVHIIMITQGKINRILPLFNPSETGNYIRGIKSSIFPFLGIEVLFAMPLTKKNGKKSIKTAFLTLLFIGAFYILVILSSVMKVGRNDIVNFNDPLIAAIRDTAPSALEFFSRLDILYLTVGFAGYFIGISITITAVTEFICRLFPKAKRIYVVAFVGGFIYFAFLTVKSLAGYEDFVDLAGTYWGLITAILIPAILLILTKIKRIHAKANCNEN